MGILALLSLFSRKAFSLDLGGLFTSHPSLSIPFSFARSGYVVTADFNADNYSDKEGRYEVNFVFENKSGDAAELHKTQALLGVFDASNGTKVGKNGELIYTRAGPLMPIRLTISSIDSSNEKTIYDKQLSQYFPGGGNQYGVHVSIDQVFLKTGHYRIRLETLGNVIPELANIPVIFEIGLHGK